MRRYSEKRKASIHHNNIYIIAIQRKRVQLTCFISVIAENKPHAYHNTHLHTNESGHDSCSQFPRSPLGIPGNMPPFLRRTDESAKASSTNNELPLFKRINQERAYEQFLHYRSMLPLFTMQPCYDEVPRYRKNCSLWRGLRSKTPL